MNHRNRKHHIQIVRDFCCNLRDDSQRLVCFFLSKDTQPREICTQLNITHDRLELIKLQIAMGLKQAGIAI